jgi:hypothetical protein
VQIFLSVVICLFYRGILRKVGAKRGDLGGEMWCFAW